MRPCPYCGKPIQDDALTCPWCQANLPTTRPVPGAAFAGAPQTNGKAIASLICGFLFFFFPSAIVAVVMGHLSLSEIGKSAGRQTGKGLAIGGLVLGYMGLSVIPILIIAAIAIPNLLRAKMAANEASAVASLRAYNMAIATYATKCEKTGFPAATTNLGPGRGDCEAAGLLDATLGAPIPLRNGYKFTYLPGPLNNRGQIISYAIHADPVAPGSTGMRYFFTDQTGVIRVKIDAPASEDSPEIE